MSIEDDVREMIRQLETDRSYGPSTLFIPDQYLIAMGYNPNDYPELEGYPGVRAIYITEGDTMNEDARSPWFDHIQRRVNDATNQDITEEEWNKYEWIDVTTLNNYESGVHRYVRIKEKSEE